MKSSMHDIQISAITLTPNTIFWTLEQDAFSDSPIHTYKCAQAEHQIAPSSDLVARAVLGSSTGNCCRHGRRNISRSGKTLNLLWPNPLFFNENGGYVLNPLPVCGFSQRRTSRGKGTGVRWTPSCSASDEVGASPKKKTCIALNERKPRSS